MQVPDYYDKYEDAQITYKLNYLFLKKILHMIWFVISEEIEKEKEQKYLPRKRDRSPMYNGKLQNYYDQYLTASDCEDKIQKEKIR